MSHFEELIDQLTERARQTPHMVKAMVELTYGCNLACVHCYNPTHVARNELTTEQVLRILDGLAAQGCLWVTFTGGELFTRRDALEIMHAAKSLGLVVHIFTNATMITPALADQIRALDPYGVDVSIYGATAETYERVTRVPGSFAKFVQGVDLLVARRVPVMLKIPLMTHNVHELEAMEEFARSRKLPHKVSTEIHPKVDGSKEPLASRLSPEQVVDVWRKRSGERLRHQAAAQASISAGSDEGCGGDRKLFPCGCGKSKAVVTPYGRMNLCTSIYAPLYDLTSGSVAEGWQTLMDVVASAKPGPSYECQACPLTRHCTRGSVDSWLEHGVFDGPCLAHFREVAERKAEFLGASSTD